MLAPHYSGIDSHDRPYTITATSGRQVGQNRIDLDAPVMDMMTSSGWVLLHADRGTSMTSKPVAQLMVDLGVARSHSRPHVSNDNPYSEAAFKTLKYAAYYSYWPILPISIW